jgi:maltooligosyltrehalose synthase
MKILTLTTALALATTVLWSQDSVNVTPPALPQGQYGTQNIPEQREEQKEDRVEVDRNRIPPAMQKALKESSRYEGWETGNIFYERNTDQYLVHIIRENKTVTFRFDKHGNPIVTDGEVSPGEIKH